MFLQVNNINLSLFTKQIFQRCLETLCSVRLYSYVMSARIMRCNLIKLKIGCHNGPESHRIISNECCIVASRSTKICSFLGILQCKFAVIQCMNFPIQIEIANDSIPGFIISFHQKCDKKCIGVFEWKTMRFLFIKCCRIFRFYVSED